MNILITYDVSLMDPKGPSRLRKVAKTCKDYGLRAQNSVFECTITQAQFVSLKSKLADIINETSDTIRIYNLGKNGFEKTELLGRQTTFNPESPLII